MEKAYIFLADGFEEIEGLTVVDILRRAGVEIQMVSIMGRKELTGSHGIPVVADAVFEEVDFSDGTLFVLPGGMPGTKRGTSERKKCGRYTAGCDLRGSEWAWRTRSA